MPVTISRPRGGRDQVDRGDEGRAEPVVNGGRERGDAAGPGLERAQRRGDQVAAARVGRSLGAQRFRHCRWSGLSGSQPWDSTETGRKRPPARPLRLYHIRFHRVNHSGVSGAAAVRAGVGVAAAAAGAAAAVVGIAGGNGGLLPPPLWGRAGEGGRRCCTRYLRQLLPHPQPLPTRGRGAHRLSALRKAPFAHPTGEPMAYPASRRRAAA